MERGVKSYTLALCIVMTVLATVCILLYIGFKRFRNMGESIKLLKSFNTDKSENPPSATNKKKL